MNDISEQGSRTFRICTAIYRFVSRLYNSTAAGRADIRNAIGNTVGRMADRANHFGNDLSGFADYDAISDTDILFINEILVVQYSPTDGCSR